MKCRICGASCRCKKRGSEICCSCHPHKRAALKFSPGTELKAAIERWQIAHGMKEEELDLGLEVNRI